MASKAIVDKVEEAPDTSSAHAATKIDDAAQHGDRALALMGDERVSLTEEDVCRIMISTFDST
jgi:hypothetical protein